MNVIEQIFNSKSLEKFVPKSEEFKQVRTAYAAAAKLLRSQMTEEQIQLWDDYTTAQVKMEKFLLTELFQQGAIFGAKLQRELLELK